MTYKQLQKANAIESAQHLKHNKEHYHGTPRHAAMKVIAKRLQLRNNILNNHVAIKRLDKVA